MTYATAILLVLTGLVAPSSRPAETPDALLEQLASADPLVRVEAGEKLLSLGVVARPAVLAATRSGSPEVRARAAELILKLPWARPSDPGEVQRVLAQYGQHDPATRAHDAATLGSLSSGAGFAALARLLVEEPSDLVRWSIVQQLHNGPTGVVTRALESLRELKGEDQPAPVLAGMALAHRSSDLAAAQALYQRASDVLARDGASAQLHLAYGDILHEHGLRTLARKELEAALALPGPHPPLLEANAHFQLASLIGDSDDRVAADHIKAGIAAFARIAGGAGLTVDHAGNRASGNDALADLKAEMHFRYYRAEAKEGNKAQAATHLEQLLALKPSRADVVLEAVPALKEMGKAEEAREMFERAYKPLKASTESDPSSAEHLNNLAWLCARCEERLDEAVRYAERAIELSPDNAAYLDTAAEAHFRAGNKAKAVELETKALKLRPGDEFMQQQLKRFQGGASEPAVK